MSSGGLTMSVRQQFELDVISKISRGLLTVSDAVEVVPIQIADYTQAERLLVFHEDPTSL